MSALVAGVAQEADALGLSGEERKVYVKERLKEERNREDEKERERKAEQLEREKRQEQLERDRWEDERQREAEKRAHELEVARVSASMSDLNVTAQASSRLPEIPRFIDGEDDLDIWLLRFERFAEFSKWPKERWTTYLSALISGRALETYSRLPVEIAQDFDEVKAALQARYDLTEHGYREKFHSATPEDGERPDMFIARIRTYLDRWFEIAEVEESVIGIKDFLIREQFLDGCANDLATHLREQRELSLDKLAKMANAFLVARNRHLKAKKSDKFKNEDSKWPEKGKEMRCFKCNSPNHKARDCKEKSNNNSNNNNHFQGRKETQRNGSHQKAAAAVMLQDEGMTRNSKASDGRVKKNGRKNRFEKRNSMDNRKDKDSGILPRVSKVIGEGEIIVDNDVVVETLSCVDQSGEDSLDVVEFRESGVPNKTASCEQCSVDIRDEELNFSEMSEIIGDKECILGEMASVGSIQTKKQNLPVVRGFIGEREVDVLRDTGCEGVVVKREYVKDEQLTGHKKFIVMINNTSVLVEEARISVRTPYFVGKVDAVCIQDAICDLIIGNVEGARMPHEPDNKMMMAGAVTTRAQQQRKGKTSSLNAPELKGYHDINKDDLIKLQEEEETLRKLETKCQVKRGNTCVWFEKQDGILYRMCTDERRLTTKRQVVLPSKLRRYVMGVAHDSIVGGHLGVQKTKDKVMSNFYWPGVEGDIKRYCKSCDICQRTVNRGATPRAPMQSIPVVDTPFKRVAMDLIGPIEPASESGHRYILTHVDYATRYPEAVPLKRIDTETVAEALVDIYSRIGVPEEILTDLGSQFVSECMKEVCRLLGIRKRTTTPYHPMCNGLTEKFNSTLKKMLKRLCTEQPKQWHRYINPLLFAYREVPQESTKFAPFELMYGRSVRGPMHILRQLWTNEIEEPDIKSSYQYVLELRERLEETWKMANEELSKAQKKQKFYYDKKTKVRKFKPGDKILVLLPTEANKLLVQWKGPFEVISAVGLNDYRIQMGRNQKTLHVNLMKEYVTREDEGSNANSNNDTSVAQIASCKVMERDDETDRISLMDTFMNELFDNYDISKQQVAFAVVHDYENDEDTTQSEDLADLGSWKQRETTADVKYGSQLLSHQQLLLKAVIEKYQSVFSDVPGRCILAEHHIDLTSDTAVRQRPYSVPYAMRDSLKEELLEMEQQGIIRRSESSYASPVVVVKKRDGTNRICIDYRRLNAVTVFDPHPAPAVTEVFQNLSHDKFFSRIDLSKGYWQIAVRESDIHKTAFVSMGEHYEFLRMPFGMMNSGATLNRAVKKLIDGMSGVTAYVDDLLVHSETFDDHLTILDELLRRMEEAKLTARPHKCLFGTSELDFVGHWLSKGTIGLHDDNITKIKNAPRPVTKKEVKSFLGLVGYYRDFLPNFAAISAPLTDTLRNGQPTKVDWGDAQQRAYMTLKQCLISKPILHLPDFDKEFVLSTDASDRAVGSMLSQEIDGKLYPIAYASRKLLPREQKYSITEKEALAIIWAIKKFNLYLYGKEFVLRTDHKSLEFLHSAKFENQRVMRWSLYLQSFRFRIEYVRGSENVGADFLSRVIV